MIPFTHPAKKIDQVDSENKDMGHGVVLHDPGEGHQEPITFRSMSSQVVYENQLGSLYLKG